MICDTCKTEQGVIGSHYEEDGKKKFRCADCNDAPKRMAEQYEKSVERFMMGKQTAVEIIKQKLKIKRDQSLL